MAGNAPQPKIRRVGQAEKSLSNESERNDWHEIKLAALQRASEFTQKAEFLDVDQHSVQVRLEMLEASWTEFGDACRAWLPTMSEPNHECLEQGEEIYIAIKAAMRSRLAVLTSQATAHSNGNVLQIQWGDMPTQERLPTFSGNFAKWEPFRDAFIAEIHNNARLTNAQRLRKVLGSLEGAAKRAVGEWSVAEDGNYLLAWESLRQQYDNNHQTIRAHMQEVSSLLPIRAKSYEDLRDVLDTVRVNRRHLLSLLTPTQLIDYQFLHQIERLLDEEGRREWEMSRRVNELPSLNEMFAFMEQRSNCMASLAMGTASSRPVPANTRSEQRDVQKSTTDSTQRGSGPSHSAPASHQGRRALNLPNEQKRPLDNRRCFKCELPGHALFHCKQFKDMSAIERRDFVQKKRLCESCFSPNHLTMACRREACPLCPGLKHNSLVCQNSNRPKAEGTVAQTNCAGGTQ